MKRVYVYLSDDEFLELEKSANTAGMSPSSHFKYLGLLQLHPPVTTTFSLPEATKTQDLYIAKRNVGDTFIVSTPFADVWPSFSRSQKSNLSQRLAKIVKNDKTLHVLSRSGNNATVYVKR